MSLTIDVQSFADLTFDELVKARIEIDKETKTRAKEELDKLEDTRNQLLSILDSDWLKTVADDKPALPKTPAPPKYRDPATGKTWSGKGKRPQWFDAERANDFLIEAVPCPSNMLTD